MTQNRGFTDIKAVRKRARDHVERGAVTEAYRADRDTVIRVLNEALATELVCVLRYKRHYYAAEGIQAEAAKAQFLEHAVQESQHADLIAERITQIGGLPNFSPAGLAERAHSEYVEGASLRDMLREDLVAERVAIDTYSERIRYLGDADPTTRRLLEEILAAEEEHAQDISSLLSGLPS